MTLIVRNEADIVGDHIAHHLESGVDRFIVVDNGSTDGTTEVLEDFARSGVLDLIRWDGDFHQARWANELVALAIDRYRPDWISAIDCDEFIVPQGAETLAAHLARQTAVQVVRCPRINVFGAYEDLRAPHWPDVMRYRSLISQPPPYDYYDPDVPSDVPFVCYEVSAKVVFRPHGFVEVSKGGHRVRLDPPGMTRATGLDIWHYPFRSHRRFAEAVLRRGPLLEKTQDDMRQSMQYRRWYAQLRQGQTTAEILAGIVPSAQVLCGMLESRHAARIQPPVRFQRLQVGQRAAGKV